MSWLGKFATTCGMLTMLVNNARAAQDPHVVVEELLAAGVSTQAAGLTEQLRIHSQGRQVCLGEEAESCQQRLRAQVRNTQRIGEQNGMVDSPDKAARVAAAVMLLAADGNVETAGEIVQTQLRGHWRADEIHSAARTLESMSKHRRWQQQTFQMLQDCVKDGTCSAKQAQTAIAAMHRASKRADIDSRWARRTVCATLQDHKQSADMNDATILQDRLRRRLNLDAGRNNTARAGHGEQQRQSYLGRMESEDRTGGSFGGNASTGPGNSTPGKRPGRN